MSSTNSRNSVLSSAAPAPKTPPASAETALIGVLGSSRKRSSQPHPSCNDPAQHLVGATTQREHRLVYAGCRQHRAQAPVRRVLGGGEVEQIGDQFDGILFEYRSEVLDQRGAVRGVLPLGQRAGDRNRQLPQRYQSSQQ